MIWSRIIWLFILFLLGVHKCFPSSPRYMELADSADFFIERENWDKAEKTIIEALRLEPANFTNSLLLANLGLVQTNKGEYKKALESLSMGLNLAPSSTVLYNNRAHTYLLLDSVSAASSDLDKSLKIDSIQEWPLQMRAFLYFREKNIGKATELFNLMQKNFPDNPAIYTGRAAIDEYNGEYDSAKKNYLKALDLNKEDEEAREAYIYVLIRTEDYPTARRQIKEGLDLNSENPMFYLLRGYLHRLNYRPEEAQADKKIAISKGLSPEYVSSFIP